MIVEMIKKNKTFSAEEVMEELSISRPTVFRDYAKIRKITGAVYDKKTWEWKC
ncbi:MAG: HTH domain-containing protein [Dysgonomonas sp.]